MKIVVIEDHQLVSDMLVLACANILPGSEVSGANSGVEGVALCSKVQPDVVFLDLALPDGDGLDFVAGISSACRSAKIIALTSHVDQFTIHRALRSNVNGFVDKNGQPLKILKEAIVAVLEGRRYYSPAVQRVRLTMREDPTGFTKVLSQHEEELLALFGAGMSNDEIAALKNLKPGTVKNHRMRIMNKLGIHGTPQLMRYAAEKGFTRLGALPTVLP
jgi:two-component system response regulator NreC